MPHQVHFAAALPPLGSSMVIRISQDCHAPLLDLSDSRSMALPEKLINKELLSHGGYKQVCNDWCSPVGYSKNQAVATLLGYFDTAAFRQGFHRWHGQRPSDYRASVQK
jgi:AraC-like DNA-binding protein